VPAGDDTGALTGGPPPADSRLAADVAAAPAPASAMPPEGDARDDDDRASVETQALAECQTASELLAAGKPTEAIAHVDRAYELLLKLAAMDPQGTDQAVRDIRLLTADLINRAYRARSAQGPMPPASTDLGLQLVDNEHVRREIQSFTTTERDLFLEGYRRSGRYRAMIVQKLERAGMPSQLAWLPMVESLFMVNALSRASALGMWQFISSTGLRYGLQRDEWVDQRLDPERSTDAAISYLADLHRLFGDWPKALAAYNCGEAAVAHLQDRTPGQFVDFWDLYQSLPGETRRYVPRLIAVLRIIEDPAKYGMTLPEPYPPATEHHLVDVSRAVQLEALDAALALPAGTLAALNPELRVRATPKAAYPLKVPSSLEGDVLAAVAKLPEYAPPRPTYTIHRVKTGESLSVIARLYRTSVSAIQRSNNLGPRNLIRPGQRLRVPLTR
jgi:membrane-bound lytic murein transglycosylase D